MLLPTCSPPTPNHRCKPKLTTTLSIPVSRCMPRPTANPANPDHQCKQQPTTANPVADCQPTSGPPTPDHLRKQQLTITRKSQSTAIPQPRWCKPLQTTTSCSQQVVVGHCWLLHVDIRQWHLAPVLLLLDAEHSSPSHDS